MDPLATAEDDSSTDICNLWSKRGEINLTEAFLFLNPNACILHVFLSYTVGIVFVWPQRSYILTSPNKAQLRLIAVEDLWLDSAETCLTFGIGVRV